MFSFKRETKQNKKISDILNREHSVWINSVNVSLAYMQVHGTKGKRSREEKQREESGMENSRCTVKFNNRIISTLVLYSL